MKIAMMTAWNEDSGASIHAELIGREWARMRHELKVFSFYTHDFHGTRFVNKDEDYVLRCFTTSNAGHPRLDPRPILEADYDVFVAQDHGMLPMDGLGKIFHHVRRKAVTLSVIHDNCPSAKPSFYQFDWDRIICFDGRYHDFLRRHHPEERICCIPYPCLPLKKGDKKAARTKLGLPKNKNIIFTFGQRVKEVLPLVPLIQKVNKHTSCLLLVVSQKDIEIFNGVKINGLEIREESPSIERLYDYLHASDVLILNRSSCDGVVVSSTAYQCLGSGCPILASDSNLFETVRDVVTTYSDLNEFEVSLLDILSKGERYQVSQDALEPFIEKNSAGAVASQYIDLFETMIEEKSSAVSKRPSITPNISNMIGTTLCVEQNHKFGGIEEAPIPGKAIRAKKVSGLRAHN